MRGYKSADSAKDWYWGTTCGEEYFGYFSDALGLPPQIEAYLRDRYSRFEFRRRPKRFARIEFDEVKVRQAIDASDDILRQYPRVERLWKESRKVGHHGQSPAGTGWTARVTPAIGSVDESHAHRPFRFEDFPRIQNSVGIDPWRLGAEYVVESVIVDGGICEYEGVDLGSVSVRNLGALGDVPTFPQFIADARKSIPAPVPNRPKAHLVEWQAPIIDQGNVVRLDLAYSDFWTSQSIQRTVPRIQEEIAEGKIEFTEFPRRLDVHLVVICAEDNSLLLTRRGSHVATEPSTWMITVGESIDWERDQREEGAPHPESTARKCLAERDELNLPTELAEAADLRLIAIATEWKEMLANLIVVARIPGLTFELARACFRRGENVRLDAVEFTHAACAKMLNVESYSGPDSSAAGLPVSDISRAALLATIRHAFGSGNRLS